MPKTSAQYNLGRRTDPQEIRKLRASNFDLMEQLGDPVIHKHRWNERDLELGLVQRCPNAGNDVYSGDHSYDDICFGTGYVGGWADGTIVFITLGDTPTQNVRFTEGGVLVMDQHPQMNAPWLPEMGDGDLIILADFDMEWEIVDLHERYELREVSPTTMRGPRLKNRSSPSTRWRVGQSAQVDKLPWGHRFYDVPIVFDSNVIPDPVPSTVVSAEYAIRVRGAEEFKVSGHTQDIWIQVAGVSTSLARSIAIKGKSKGAYFNW